MAQFNIRLDNETHRTIDGIAAKRGITTPELARQTMGELISADAQGRAMFDRSQDLDPIMVTRALIASNATTTELDRVLRDLVKLQAKLAKQAVGDADRMTQARNEFIASLPPRLEKSYAPFRDDMSAMRGEIGAKLDDVRRIAQIPKNSYIIKLTDERFWSIGFFFLISLMTGFLLTLLFLFVTSLIGPTRAFVIDRMLKTDQQLCTYLEDRYGKGCEGSMAPVARPARKVARP